MGVMTIYATIARSIRQVAVGSIEFTLYLSMALQTLTLTDSLLRTFMARITPLGKRLMLDITNQCFPVASMGIMARKTSLNFYRISFMVILYLCIGVTRATDLLVRIFQHLGIICLVRPMTGRTFSLGIGLVGIFIFFLQIGMTGQATINQASLYETPGSGRMWFMADCTVSKTEGIMHKSLLICCRLITVAGKTKIRYLFLEQP